MEDSFTITDLFSGIHEENIFLYTKERNYTYSDTLQFIETYRNYLAEKTVTNHFAAVKMNTGPGMIFTIMAMWSLKITPVLINTRLTDRETQELIDYTGCAHIFSEEITRPENLVPEKHQINFDDKAVIIFTSGSTGRPKGVELTFRTLRDAASRQNNFLQTAEGDRWLMSLPFYHIGGFSILTRSLYGNNPIIIPDTLKTEDLFSAADKFKPQFLSLVGAQLKKLIEAGYKPDNKVKNLLIGGGFTDEKLVTETLNRGWKITKVYGSTETAAFVTAVSGDELRKYPSSAGKELVKDSVHILDDEGNQLPAGSEGEIGLRNIPLMKSYYKDKEETASRYSNGYFLTKDRGYINDEGYLFVLMRRSDLIVTGGENVNPHEVQSAIMSIDGIEDVYVFGAEDVKWGQKVQALIKTRVNYSDKNIKEILSKKLADYKIPKDIFFTDEIPRNEMGKIDFRKLKLWS